jgi:putative transposase
VSAVGDNPKTSQDKSPSSKKNTRKRKSSAKSVEDSTSKGKNLQPYWNESCLEMSQQLWSLTKIGLPDLDLIGLTGSAESLDAQSWFDRETNLSPEAEMVEDILAIRPCFSSRLYGLGKYKNQSKKDKSLSQSGVEETVE